jgi:hypothetical protein
VLEVFVQDAEMLRKAGEMIPGEVCTGFQERGCYLIRKPNLGYRLFVDDALLLSDADDLFWQWSPGFYAGQVVAELQVPGQHDPHQFFLDVSPNPDKAGQELFSHYVADVADYAPELLLGTEPATQSLSGQSSLTNVWIAYVRLRAFAPQYIRALREVVANPITRLSHYREKLPIHLARHVDVTTVQRLANNTPLLVTMATLEKGGTAQDLLLDDATVDVPFNEPSVDNPANQQMLRQLLDIIRRVEWVTTELEGYHGRVSETETEVLTRIPRRLQYLKGVWRELTNIVRHHPFSSVTRREPGAAGLNAVSGHPHYAYTHQHGTKLLRRGVSRLDTEERLYVGPTWQIYEAWCFCALAKYLEEALPEYHWQRHESFAHVEMLVEGISGETRLRLYFQLTSPSLSPPKSHGYYSISRERRPDLILEIKAGGRIYFVSLDAKYMASRQSILEAMSSAHIYKDSIKKEEKPPALALLLVPTTTEVTALAAEDYRKKYGVGCVELSSAETAQRLIESILVEVGLLTVMR